MKIGLIEGPTTSPYFKDAAHTSDRLSIQLNISFKKQAEADGTITGNDLVWGNDFDTPIKDKLPYGFSFGYKILKYAVDPSIFGDPYGEKPYLYGPALTSFNLITVNSKPKKSSTGSNGSAGDRALEWPGTIKEENLQNKSKGEYKYLPPNDPGARRKFYLTEANRLDFKFKTNDFDSSASDSNPSTDSDTDTDTAKGPSAQTVYGFDFFTPYLDLGKTFGIKLPGFSFNVEGYANGQPLRYTLKNYKTGQVYLVVVLTLHKQA